MSDKPKTPPPDAPPILKEPKVDVTVTPRTRDPDDRQYADKVRRSLKSDVEKAVAPREGDKSADQFKRGGDAVREASEKVDAGKVKEISVDVRGKVGREKVGKSYDVTTKPPPAPAPAAPTPPKPDPTKTGPSHAPGPAPAPPSRKPRRR